MKRFVTLLLVVVTALTLSACAAATNPALDHGGNIGAYSVGP